MTQQQSTFLTLSVIIILAIGGGYLLKQNLELGNKVENLGANTQEFEGVKSNLLSEIDKLQIEYGSLLRANNKLKSTFAGIVKEMAEKDVEIAQIKASQANYDGLMDEVKRLRMLKEEYAFVLNELRLQAVILNDSNSELQRQNADLKRRMAEMQNTQQKKIYQSAPQATEEMEMGSALQASTSSPNTTTQLDRTKSGPSGDVKVKKKATNSTVSFKNLRADNFTIDIRNKKMEVTDKTKKVRKISIRYEVNGLTGRPKESTRMYLVVLDPNGESVLTEQATRLPLTAMDNIKGKPIMAQQVMSANLRNGKSLKFEFAPMYKALVSGNYTAKIYSEYGYLGSKTFSLK